MKCAVTDCPTGVSPGHIACRSHYLQIPKHLRDVLVEAFRARQSDPSTFARAVAATRDLAQTYSAREPRCSSS